MIKTLFTTASHNANGQTKVKQVDITEVVSANPYSVRLVQSFDPYMEDVSDPNKTYACWHKGGSDGDKVVIRRVTTVAGIITREYSYRTWENRADAATDATAPWEPLYGDIAYEAR